MKACSPWLLMKFSDNCFKEIQFTVNRTTKIYAYTFKKLHAWLKAAHSFMSEGVLFHLHAIRSESSWGHAEELVSITSMIKQRRVKTDSLLQKPQIKHGCGYSVDRDVSSDSYSSQNCIHQILAVSNTGKLNYLQQKENILGGHEVLQNWLWRAGKKKNHQKV